MADKSQTLIIVKDPRGTDLEAGEMLRIVAMGQAARPGSNTTYQLKDFQWVQQGEDQEAPETPDDESPFAQIYNLYVDRVALYLADRTDLEICQMSYALEIFRWHMQGTSVVLHAFTALMMGAVFDAVQNSGRMGDVFGESVSILQLDQAKRREGVLAQLEEDFPMLSALLRMERDALDSVFDRAGINWLVDFTLDFITGAQFVVAFIVMAPK